MRYIDDFIEFDAATLECSHCSDVAFVSVNGYFRQGDGKRCISCGFPGHVVVTEEYDDEGDERGVAYWRCRDGNDDTCTDPSCSECADVRVAMGLPSLQEVG